MTDFLIVPAANVAGLTGPYGTGKAIQPRLLADGRSALPTRLLKDEDCLVAFPALSGLSIESLVAADFATEE